MAKRTYADVVRQIEDLRAEADRLRKNEVEGVVTRIREAIAAYDLTAEDLFGTQARAARRQAPGKKKASKKKTDAPTAAKYSDAEGNVWGGRGPRPQWLRNALGNGANLEDFLAKA